MFFSFMCVSQKGTLSKCHHPLAQERSSGEMIEMGLHKLWKEQLLRAAAPAADPGKECVQLVKCKKRKSASKVHQECIKNAPKDV